MEMASAYMEVYGTKRTAIQEVVNFSPLNLDSYLLHPMPLNLTHEK